MADPWLHIGDFKGEKCTRTRTRSGQCQRPHQANSDDAAHNQQATNPACNGVSHFRDFVLLGVVDPLGSHSVVIELVGVS